MFCLWISHASFPLPSPVSLALLIFFDSNLIQRLLRIVHVYILSSNGSFRYNLLCKGHKITRNRNYSKQRELIKKIARLNDNSHTHGSTAVNTFLQMCVLVRNKQHKIHMYRFMARIVRHAKKLMCF